MYNNIYNTNTIFTDCFNTIIFRKVKTKQVFKQWSIELSKIYNIDWKVIYKTYNSINFKLCFKKLFTRFTLQEHFSIVLEHMFHKLSKKYQLNNISNFVKTADELYFNTELGSFYLNQDMVNFLQAEKDAGKKIYLVSDFYCKSDTLLKWLTALEIDHLFDKVFSSSDFEKEKATKKIYKHLIKELQLDPKDITMYGDNIWSDVMMAKSCKLHAIRIKHRATK